MFETPGVEYVNRTSEDVVEEAGGKVTNIEGNKWNPYQKNFIASNSAIHKDILSCIVK